MLMKPINEKIAEEREKMRAICGSYLVSAELKKAETRAFEEWLEDVNAIKKRSARKRTLKKNIERKNLVWYTTLTFRDDNRLANPKKIFDAIRKIFRRYGIQYYLVPDWGEQTGRLHLHGFISDNPYITPKIISHKKVKDKYKNKVYELTFWEKNYGFSDLKRFDEKEGWQRAKILNYVVKYVLKSGARALSNRLSKNDSGADLRAFLRENAKMI